MSGAVGDLEGVVIDGQAVAHPGMRAIPFDGAAGLLTRPTGRIRFGVRALLIVAGVLFGGLLRCPYQGAALPAPRQPLHL